MLKTDSGLESPRAEARNTGGMNLANTVWVIRIVGILAAIGWTAWSGFRPGPSDSRKWYDRLIRAVGGLIVLAALTFGLILKISEEFAK
jgi:hypothetical protein